MKRLAFATIALMGCKAAESEPLATTTISIAISGAPANYAKAIVYFMQATSSPGSFSDMKAKTFAPNESPSLKLTSENKNYFFAIELRSSDNVRLAGTKFGNSACDSVAEKVTGASINVSLTPCNEDGSAPPGVEQPPTGEQPAGSGRPAGTSTKSITIQVSDSLNFRSSSDYNSESNLICTLPAGSYKVISAVPGTNNSCQITFENASPLPDACSSLSGFASRGVGDKYIANCNQ